jgi:hypothetical protein
MIRVGDVLRMIILPFIASMAGGNSNRRRRCVCLTHVAREPEGDGEPLFHELATLPTAAVSNEQPQKKCVFGNWVHADNLTHDGKECAKSAHSHQQANAHEFVANKRVSPKQ